MRFDGFRCRTIIIDGRSSAERTHPRTSRHVGRGSHRVWRIATKSGIRRRRFEPPST
jgi:hypothetical protein